MQSTLRPTLHFLSLSLSYIKSYIPIVSVVSVLNEIKQWTGGNQNVITLKYSLLK